MNDMVMHGALEDAIADKINDAVFGSGKGGVIDNNSPAVKSKAEFYSNVLSSTGRKFVTSKEGGEVVTKALGRITIYGILPGVLIGLGIGYFLWRKRGS